MGSHILSGNVLETKALDELIPEWKEDPDCPIKVLLSQGWLARLAISVLCAVGAAA